MRRSKKCNTPAPPGGAVKGAADEIARASAADGEQAELFGLPSEDPHGEIEKARDRGVKGGRPKGQSIATGELRAWLLSRGVLPQQSQMQWFQLGPEGLAKALGCTKLQGSLGAAWRSARALLHGAHEAGQRRGWAADRCGDRWQPRRGQQGRRIASTMGIHG